MSGNLWLDGFLLAVSIFNIIVMLWLGLMIIFNAEQRSWGVWLAAGGLLAGGLFFTSHAALLGQNIAHFTTRINFWWHLGWAPVIVAPFLWYIVMLWFSGFWQSTTSALRKRHQPWLSVVVVYAVLIFVLLILANQIGNLDSDQTLSYSADGSDAGFSALFIAYPVFILLCTGLSMDALLRPGPAHRLMGQNARQSARPWLVGASSTLLITSAIVGYTIGWVLNNLPQADSLPELYGNIAPSLAWFDLILSCLVTLAGLFVGEAVVSYEIFTGKPLPRRGFRWQWMSVLGMAAIISVASALAFEVISTRIYVILFVVILFVVFFAFFSWRFAVEREESTRQLRPFLGTQHLANTILGGITESNTRQEVDAQFIHLVRDVLQLKRSVLLPCGPLEKLGISPLLYPVSETELIEVARKVTPQFYQGKINIHEVLDGEGWIVPLVSQRGLDGLLVLGEKAEIGFLAQEELEIARAAGERLVDLLLTDELARRLVQLQRERYIDQALADQHPRRLIHDEVLPKLHAAMLELSSKGEASIPQTVDQLGQAHKQLSGLLREMPAVHTETISRLGWLNSLKAMVQQEYASAFREVEWEVDEHFSEQLDQLSTTVSEVLFYAAREAIRNAARHGRQGQTVNRLVLRCQSEGKIKIEIEDDGKGIKSGASLPSGHGLELHRLMLAIIGGSLTLESEENRFTRVRLEL